MSQQWKLIWSSKDYTHAENSDCINDVLENCGGFLSDTTRLILQPDGRVFETVAMPREEPRVWAIYEPAH